MTKSKAMELKMSMQPLKIIELIEAERYEEGLGVGYESDSKEKYDAYTKLIFDFRDQDEVQNALNHAFAVLVDEKDADKGRRFFRLGKYAEAAPHLRKAAEMRGSADDQKWLQFCKEKLKNSLQKNFEKGKNLLENGKCEEALQFFSARATGNLKTSYARALSQITQKKKTIHVYPEDYFLDLLDLKRRQSYGSPARDGTPTWWERRARMSYNCSSCRMPIEKGERYIGCKKLHPGVRGIYGHRGTYSTDYYHVVCLLGEERKSIESKINSSNSEINSIQREVGEYRKAVSAKRGSIEACRNAIRQVREDYERASGVWKKASGWFKCTYTSWSRNKKISALEDEIARIENLEIPERQSKVRNLTAIVESLRRRSNEVGASIKELTSSGNA